MFTGLLGRDNVNIRNGDRRRAPGYLELLRDTAYNRTRLGDSPIHHRNGDRPLPLNPRAFDLLAHADETLGRWFCAAHGQGPQWTSTRQATMAAMCAYWLAEHTALLARLPDVDSCFDEVRALIAAIERCINRPPPLLACGPCPTLVGPNVECGYVLQAPAEAVEITCRQCGSTHSVDRLKKQVLAAIGHRRYTRADLLRLLDCLGEPIPRQTISDWIRDGKLHCRGYLRPGPPGALPRFGLTRQSPADKPVYRLEEARALRRSR